MAKLVSSYLADLKLQQQNLAVNLNTRGVAASSAELFNTLVPKVLDVPSALDFPIPDYYLDAKTWVESPLFNPTTWGQVLEPTAPPASVTIGNGSWGTNGLICDASRITFDGSTLNHSAWTLAMTFTPVFTGAYPRLTGEPNNFPGIYLHSGFNYQYGYIGQGIDTRFSNNAAPLQNSVNYLVVTQAPNDVNLYSNGVHGGTVAPPQALPSVGTGMLGANNLTTRFFTGTIHSFMWFNRILTTREITLVTLSEMLHYPQI